jgi:hypothetical protein
MTTLLASINSCFVFWVLCGDCKVCFRAKIITSALYICFLLFFSFFEQNNFIVQAKGYRVGPVYDDVLAMAWFFLELIVKSMALEKTRLFYHSLPTGIFKLQETYSCYLL